MKNFLKYLGILLSLLIVYALYILWTTGIFRNLEPYISRELVSRIPIAGAEDFAISRADSFLIVSSDDRAARRDGWNVVSGLYKVDLKSTELSFKRLTEDLSIPFYPHGISMIQLPDRYRIWAINHFNDPGNTGKDPLFADHNSIEVFDLFGDSIVHIQTMTDPMIQSPNDILAIDEQKFYFTNDHGSTGKLGKILEDYLGLKKSNVSYFDGATYRLVAEDIAYANGINFDATRNLLFVASARGFIIKVYDIAVDGSLTEKDDIKCGTGVDNIELDSAGKLWVGCHPKLLHFTSYAAGKSDYSPSEVIRIDYRGDKDYEVTNWWTNDGGLMSASTVAIPFGGNVYIGNVMDKHMLVLKE